jgi:hypothetical protein
VHPPAYSPARPLLLLPYEQVSAFISEIAASLHRQVPVPAYPFTITFFDDDTPQPTLLGTSRSREEHDSLKASVPNAPIGYGEPPPGASETLQASFENWYASYEDHIAASKSQKSGRGKQRRNNGPAGIQVQSWCVSLTRAQRYLGLRTRRQSLVSPVKEDFGETKSPWSPAETADTGRQSSLDLTKPAPFDFQGNPILISIDVESAERDHGLVTEVGVSTLDTNDLKGLAPGDYGKNWRTKIRSRHFRIAEYAHMRNHEFVNGCPEDFQFGNSEIVSLAEIGEQIDRCFEWPYSAKHVFSGAPQREPATSGQTLSPHASTTPNVARFGSQGQSHDRLVLLVGHDVKGDIEHFAKLGSATFSPEVPRVSHPPASIDTSFPEPRIAHGGKLRSVIGDVLDTASLYKALTNENNKKSLGSLLLDYDITGWYLHNAGNDARYTLEALIGLIIQSRLQSDISRAENTVETDMAEAVLGHLQKE